MMRSCSLCDFRKKSCQKICQRRSAKFDIKKVVQKRFYIQQIYFSLHSTESIWPTKNPQS